MNELSGEIALKNNHYYYYSIACIPHLLNHTSHIVLKYGEIHVDHIYNPYIESKKGQCILYVKVVTCVILQICLGNLGCYLSFTL